MTGVTTDGACQERDLAEGFPPSPSPGAPGRARPWAPASPLQPPPPPPQLPDCSQMWQLINSFLWVTTLSGICQCFEPNATVSDHCANTPVGTACRHLRRVSALPPPGGQGACMRRLGLPRGPFQPAGGTRTGQWPPAHPGPRGTLRHSASPRDGGAAPPGGDLQAAAERRSCAALGPLRPGAAGTSRWRRGSAPHLCFAFQSPLLWCCAQCRPDPQNASSPKLPTRPCFLQEARSAIPGRAARGPGSPRSRPGSRAPAPRSFPRDQSRWAPKLEGARNPCTRCHVGQGRRDQNQCAGGLGEGSPAHARGRRPSPAGWDGGSAVSGQSSLEAALEHLRGHLLWDRGVDLISPGRGQSQLPCGGGRGSTLLRIFNNLNCLFENKRWKAGTPNWRLHNPAFPSHDPPESSSE